MDIIRIIIEHAKREIGMLRAEIQYHASHQKESGDDELELAYWRFHRAIINARSVLLRLSTHLEAWGDDPEQCPEISSLSGLVEQAAVAKSTMYDQIFANQKKGSLKAFKHSIATLIEKGISPGWMASVSKDDILNHGGEINRLYQVLVEGKTAGSLLVDSVTLENAAMRYDLFTEKQRETLRRRSGEVEILMLQDIEKLIREIQLQEEIKNVRDSVQEISLATAGSLAVQDATQSSLESVGDAWACAQCTFLNEESSNTCGGCGMTWKPEQAQSFLAVAKQRRQPQANSSSHSGAPSIFAPAPKVTKRIKKGGGYPIWIRACDVPEFIGPGGRNAAQLKKDSGAIFVSAEQDRVDAGMCPIVIKGTPKAIQESVAIVEKKFSEPPSRRVTKSEVSRVWIRNVDVPRLIGPHGSKVTALKEETGVNYIFAHQDQLNTDGQCPVEIGGPSEAVANAAEIIRRQFIDVQTMKGHLSGHDDLKQGSKGTVITKEVLILNADVPELIGPCGRSVQALIKTSGVQSITAWQERVGSDGMCPVAIKGDSVAVQKAFAEIQGNFCGKNCSKVEAPANISTVCTRPLPHGKVRPPSPHGNVGPPSPLDHVGPPLPHANVGPPSPHTNVGPPSPHANVGPPTEVLVVAPTEVRSTNVSIVVPKSPLGDGEIGETLLSFLGTHAICLTSSPAVFLSWLHSEHIFSLDDFAEALNDADFAREEMKPNGLKYFKRLALRKAILERANVAKKAESQPETRQTHGEVVEAQGSGQTPHLVDAPNELICPIRHVLMINDPVVASDGKTYEREAIESWFERAKRESGHVRSPITQAMLEDLSLRSNEVIRIMARDFANKYPGYS